MSFTPSTGARRSVRPFAVTAVVLATVAAAVLPLSSASGATRARRPEVRPPAARVAVGSARVASQDRTVLLADGHRADHVTTGAAGSISGKVTDNHGNALPGICVSTYSTTSSGSAISGSSGSYTISGLAAGSFTVYFIAGCGSTSDNWVEQYWKDADNYEDASPVTVTAGKTTSGINAAMQPGATISGTVSSGGQAVAVTVDAVDGSYDTSTSLGAGGAYSVSQLPAGSYTVEFTPEPGENLLPQWWKNATTESAATILALSTGQSVTGINASMKPGGVVTGTVKDTSGAGLGNICVYFDGVDVPSPGSFAATTASDGTYSVVGLPTGAYIAEFSPCDAEENWLTQYWRGAATADESTVVSVTAGGTTSGVSPVLLAGGEVTGTVKSGSGAHLGGICVYVTPVAGGEGGGSTTTASNGTYSVVGLASGTYVAEFVAGCASSYNWITQYSGGAATAATAKTIVVKAKSSTGGVNASLVAGGEITGTVTGHGAKLGGICVDVFNSDNVEVGNAYTSSNGAYAVMALASGRYQVEFTNCGSPSDNWASQWYHGASSQAGAATVGVKAGKTTSGINAALAAGGTIDGTLTIVGAGAVNSGCVEAYPVVPGFVSGSAYTDATGSYSITGLTPGRYVLFFDPLCGPNNGLSSYYKGASTPKTAKQVTVVGGKAVVANASLAKGGEISGTVTGPSKTGLRDVCVDISSASDPSEFVADAETTVNGSYSIMGLRSGTYVAEFTDCSEYPLYASQWYRGRGTEASATHITVTAGKHVTGINAQLSGGGTIKGTVKRSGGVGEPDVCVYAYSTNNSNGGAYTTTSGNGSYVLYGIEPGKYDIEFEPDCIGITFGPIWYKSGLYQSESAAVSVSSGHTTSGVDVTLPRAGEISGVVKAGSKAIVEACVEAFFAHTKIEAGGTESYADGTYEIAGLAPGSYDVWFLPYCAEAGNIAPQWWKKAPSEVKATTVKVISGRDIAGIDASLTAGGQIAGVVKNSAGSVLPGVEVEAIAKGSNELAAYAYANAHGNYTLTGLLAGSYIVVFNPGSECDDAYSIYAQQYWKDTASASAAKAVGVTVGKTTTGINASLVLSSTPGSSYIPAC